MAARIRMRDSGGTLRTITQLRMRDSGGTLRTITRVRMRDAGNVLRVVYDTTGASTFAVTSSPSLVSGQTAGTGTATTDVTTASATGGTAPYTYAWTRISQSSGTASTATSAATAATAFTKNNMAPGADYSAVWRVTATDSASPANTATFDVDAFWTDTT